MNLSPAQKRFLIEFTRTGCRFPPTGYAGAGRDASAYYRTERSLKKLGLVTRRYPSQRTDLTWLGLAWAVTL
jgi:hypothetical protein